MEEDLANWWTTLGDADLDRLMERAVEIAHQRGFRRLAVIAAVGTRRYYLGRGFERRELYLVKEISA